MFTLKTDKIIDRQVQQISFLSQYIHGIEHVNGRDNVIPDVLSRLEVAALQNDLPDSRQWSEAQAIDTELNTILSAPTK